MKTNKSNSASQGKSPRIRDYPELQVGFPERNDATSPNQEMERIHVDLETLDISRKNEAEVTRAIVGEEPNIK
jgi:hypothetical protein